MAKTRTNNAAKRDGMFGPFTKAEIKMLQDAVDAYESVVEDDVNEYQSRPESDLDVYEDLKRKVR